MMNNKPDPRVDATVRKYLTDKVREKYPEDFHLLESKLEEMVSKYSLKELLIVCSVEIAKLKNSRRGEAGRWPHE